MAKIKLIFAWYDFWIGLYWNKEKHSLYIFPIPMFGLRITFFSSCGYVLMKYGLFYRPNYSGYTNTVSEAGLYTYNEAKKHECKRSEPVTMHHISEFL